MTGSDKIYVHNLTPLRGIAALLVVIYHLNLVFRGALAGGATTGILSQLYLMVDLFFMISGFVMCHVYGDWFKERISFANFMRFSMARFARIYPMYLVSLVFLILVVFGYQQRIGETPQLFKDTFDFGTIPLNLLLLQSMNTLSYLGWNIPSWSVSVEWWVYMIFPAMVFGWGKYGPSRINIFILALCAVGYSIISVWLHNTSPLITSGTLEKDYTSIDVTFNYGFFRCLLGFVVGMVIHKFFLTGKCRETLSADSTIILLLGMLLVSLHFSIPNYITVWIFPVLILAVAYGSARTNKFLNHPALMQLGNLSYSIYLMHMPLLYSFILFLLFVPDASYMLPSNNQVLSAWVVGYAFISLTLIVSYFAYTYIELPARSAIKALVRT